MGGVYIIIVFTFKVWILIFFFEYFTYLVVS